MALGYIPDFSHQYECPLSSLIQKYPESLELGSHRKPRKLQQLLEICLP